MPLPSRKEKVFFIVSQFLMPYTFKFIVN